MHQSLDLAVQGDDAERIGSTWHNLVEAYGFAGRPAEAVELAARGLADLERLGLHRTYAALTTGQLTLALLGLGRWADADTVSAAVLAGDVDPYFALPVKFGRLHLLIRQGRFAEAEALLSDLDTRFGAYDYTAGVGAVGEAELALWQRDWKRARAALARADEIIATTTRSSSPCASRRWQLVSRPTSSTGSAPAPRQVNCRMLGAGGSAPGSDRSLPRANREGGRQPLAAVPPHPRPRPGRTQPAR